MRDVEVEFAVRDGAYIAYEIFGSGTTDLVLVPNALVPIDLMWDLPQLSKFLDALGEIARVIAFDPRGTGASDPLPTTDGAAGIENAASDLLAVLDAAGSERASIMTLYAGGTHELVFAATYPQRVRSLIVSNLRTSFPELHQMTVKERKSLAAWLSSPDALKLINPRVAHDPVLRRWWGRARRLAGSPEETARLMEFAGAIDTRSVLGDLRTPTLVLHREGNQMWDIESSRAAASCMPNARFVQLPGSDSEIFVGDTAPVLNEITRFLQQSDTAPVADDRQLATVLFTDIVSSTEHLASVGDHAWRSVLDDHDKTIDQSVSSYRGRVVTRLGDGMLATFDGPARAVRCAAAIRDRLAASGLTVRSGLHTGEIEWREDDVAGIAVHLGQRVSALAAPGEILVTRTVVDLTAGSGITYESRGERALKGIPGSWQIFQAHAPSMPDP